MKDLITMHFQLIFECTFLLVLFVIGGVFLMWQPDNQQLASWITGGAVIGVIGRALGSRGKDPVPPTPPGQVTSSVATTVSKTETTEVKP